MGIMTANNGQANRNRKKSPNQVTFEYLGNLERISHNLFCPFHLKMVAIFSFQLLTCAADGLAEMSKNNGQVSSTALHPVILFPFMPTISNEPDIASLVLL